MSGQLVTVDNPKYIAAVEAHVERAPVEVHDAINMLQDFEVYFWGGAVRDPIFGAIHTPLEDDDEVDYDLIVDDSETGQADLGSIFQDEIDAGTAELNRFDTIKWKPCEGLTIDVSRFTNANRLRDWEPGDPPIQPGIETLLSGCDFTTGAIAFNWDRPMIYDYGAIAALEARKIDFLYAGDEPEALMSRIVMHADRMGLSIQGRATSYIRYQFAGAERKGPMSEKIQAYLHYKGKDDKFESVISRLDRICRN